MAKPAPGRRPIVWISAAAVVIIVVAAVLVVSLGGGGTTTSSHTTSTTTTTTTTQTCSGSSTSQTIPTVSGPVVVGATGKVAAGVACADGHLGTILQYNYSQPINIQVTVLNSLTPTAIQTVYDGNPQNTNQWNVTSTGRTYVLGYGNAGETALTACTFAHAACVHDVYAVVTFSDNSTATSNAVYFTVVGAPSA